MLVEYDGTRYHGFQVQRHVPTIQGEVEKAIAKVIGEPVPARGAGRTDAGVHARGQVVAFETSAQLSPRAWVGALNTYLPRDIAIRRACQVGGGFDPRRDATSREYRYSMLNAAVPSPLSGRYACLVPGKIDCGVMNAASRMLVGQHDFAPFTGSRPRAGGTVRRVFVSEVRKEGDFVYFDMVATAFLPQQMRRTIGSLLRVASGRMALEEFAWIAASGRLGLAQPVAPPHGLCLIKVNYSGIGIANYEDIQH